MYLTTDGWKRHQWEWGALESDSKRTSDCV